MNNQKVLVVYGSKYGTTQEIAEFINNELKNSNINSDIKNFDEITNLAEYNTIIIGAPIYFDNWMKDAQVFIRDNKESLSTKKVFYFFTCMTLAVKNERSQKAADTYKNMIYNTDSLVKPSQVKGFAGAVNEKKIPFLLKIALMLILRIKDVKTGDYRNWYEIRQWVDDIKLAIIGE